MECLFDSQANRDKLKQVLNEWKGTPYRHWCGVKGLGCDCIHFVVRVLEEFGLGPFKIPWYPRDWNLNNTQELLWEGIRKNLPVVLGDVNNPRDGDLILYRFGKTISHSGFYYNKHVYQAVNDVGVISLSWTDEHWYKRRKYAVRIIV